MPRASTRASASRTRTPAIEPIGRDFRKRHEHERALEQVRMRQNKVAVDEDKIVIGEEIDVDGARPPAALVRAVAAERALAFLRARQESRAAAAT